MIAIIRITGQLKLSGDVKETLDRLRIRKKYACVVLPEKPELIGMAEKVRNFVAYGKIDRETFLALIKKRGKTIGKGKIEAEKIVDEIMDAKKEIKLIDFEIKPFFSLHPPRGGINSKLHFPKGVLGDNKGKLMI